MKLTRQLEEVGGAALPSPGGVLEVEGPDVLVGHVGHVGGDRVAGPSPGGQVRQTPLHRAFPPGGAGAAERGHGGVGGVVGHVGQVGSGLAASLDGSFGAFGLVDGLAGGVSGTTSEIFKFVMSKSRVGSTKPQT